MPLLELGHHHQWRWDQSWLVTSRTESPGLAGMLGLQGVAWVGEDLPEAPLGVTINQANDLPDAPRVMIPPGGGCWHDPSRK